MVLSSEVKYKKKDQDLSIKRTGGDEPPDPREERPDVYMKTRRVRVGGGGSGGQGGGERGEGGGERGEGGGEGCEGGEGGEGGVEGGECGSEFREICCHCQIGI